jgi:enterochelin esterase family protein
MRPTRTSGFVLILLLFVTPLGTATAQQRQRVVSPEIGVDRTVTFRFRAPRAHQVLVSVEYLDGLRPLRLGDDGVWSVTLGPLEPELYSYNFVVDGVATVDPLNPVIKIGTVTTQSLLDIPGDPPLFWNERPVPRGTVHLHRYDSKTLGITRGLNVYTPPGYSRDREDAYPILYLLHGAGDNERGWTTIGRANVILDNLIAEEKAAPMIVVMPDGHAPQREGIENAFREDLLNDIIPYVEARYRIKPGPEGRALAGLSMGGFQTLEIGVARQDLFGWIGVFSGGIREGYEKTHGAFLDSANDNLRLFWIGIGKTDFLRERNENLLKLLREKKAEHTFRLSEGGHTWKNWRAYLHEFAQLLFK